MVRTIAAICALMFALACQAAPASGQDSALEREFPRLDIDKRSVDLAEIESGGVPRDAIPAILDPVFIPLADAEALSPEEPVITLAGDCGAFAFPFRVLIWHEIAHHDFCGVPVAVTYCPLCNTALVFDRRVAGNTLSFGTSGRLRNSDLVMYDHQSESLWQQFTGEAIVGEMTGERLTTIPARIESVARFAAAHPGGRILAPPVDSRRAYGSNPYVGYDTLPEPGDWRRADSDPHMLAAALVSKKRAPAKKAGAPA